MRKIQKKQAENLVELLGKAHDEIKKTIDRKDIPVILTLLEDCQAGAVALGNLIEQTEEADSSIISLLEDYCELVYQVYEKMAQKGKINSGQIYKQLHKFYIQIKNRIRNDIQIHKEAVFLPYKASMWDSMESVWQAAVQDTCCDTYVIPIPYYERNPDGSLGIYHYEENEYPAYVPVTKYETFDFAKHQPDMIFIHNPYDQYNLVTTVHPFFYSKNIRQFTDCLVYIPYYEIGREQAKSFYTLPLYFTVDYIVAQSKQHMLQFDKRVSDKILIAGSPKFDKIINRKIKAEEIPESWRGKLNLRDKIFFYNTSITGLLQDSVRTIEKMRSVFEIFSKSETTLIWRPHPLFESTIKTMRPEIWKKYKETVDIFEQLKYGILDQTSDSSLGVKLSDAYIGEETSSMVHLFGVLGKPIFISNVAIHEDYTKETGYARYFGVVEEEDVLWMLAGDRNGLVRYEKNSGAVKLFEIPNEKFNGCRLYNTVISHRNCLYLIPYNGSEIAIFDKIMEQFTKIAFRDPLSTNFAKAYLYQDKIYMIPARYPSILKLDCETNQITYIDIPDSGRLLHDSKTPFSFNGSMLTGSTLLIALTFDDLILQFNLASGEMKIIEINVGSGMEATGFWCMEGDGEHIILGSNAGRRLVYWNTITNESKILESYPEDWQGDDKCFFEMTRLDNDVYVFPKTGNIILKINLKSLKIEPFGEDAEGFCNMISRKNPYYNWASNTFFAKYTEEHILFQRACDLQICEIRKTQEIEEFSVDLSKTMKETDIGNSFCDRGKNLPWSVKETRLITIPRFIQYVRNETHDTDKQIREYSIIADNLDGTAGEKIYRRISENDSN